MFVPTHTMGRAIDVDYSDAPAMLLSPKQDTRDLPHSNLSQNPFAFPSGTAQLPALNLSLNVNPTTPRYAMPSFFGTTTTTCAVWAYEQQPPKSYSTVAPPKYRTPSFSCSKRKRSHSDFAAEESVSAAPAPLYGEGTSRYDSVHENPIDRRVQRSTREAGYRTPYDRSPEPQVDNITQALGISWQYVSTDDKDMAAAIRGWEKYINNHYARYIHDARILLKHKGLNAYLVSSASRDACNSSQSWYLFNEDLSEARLVASDWTTCRQRLGWSPIQFPEDSEVIKPEQMQSMEAGAGAGAGAAAGAEMESGGSGMEMTMDLDS